MNKRAVTRDKILQKGVAHASRFGLLSVTIGVIAKACELSRTGVISHFASKQDMQIAILQYTEALFVNNVLKKSYTQDPLANLKSLKLNWLNWSNRLEFGAKGGCPFIKAAAAYSDVGSNAINDFMHDQQRRLLHYLADLAERCKDSGAFNGQVDSELFAYEYYSLYIGHSMQRDLIAKEISDKRFFDIIDALVERHR
ncbi:MAG: TetR/AcrR family transcriptional regulator [Oceanospirillaceae bacterium]|nr:TetR/AcrR family transcriptional regulator [Oceanospirillaceae bacterium]